MGTERNMFPEATAEGAKRRAELAPNQIDTWRKFSRAVFKSNALDSKTKHIIAIAVGHVTQCPYCIRAHVPHAIRKGATREEIFEAIWIAAQGRANGGYQQASIAVHQMEINESKVEEDRVDYVDNSHEMAEK